MTHILLTQSDGHILLILAENIISCQRRDQEKWYSLTYNDGNDVIKVHIRDRPEEVLAMKKKALATSSGN